MKRDRFQTAGRLAEQLQELAPRDCAHETIELTVNRFLRRRDSDGVAPTSVDHAILARMDDRDLGYYAWMEGDLDALKLHRGAAKALEGVS